MTRLPTTFILFLAVMTVSNLTPARTWHVPTEAPTLASPIHWATTGAGGELACGND